MIPAWAWEVADALMARSCACWCATRPGQLCVSCECLFYVTEAVLHWSLLQEDGR